MLESAAALGTVMTPQESVAGVAPALVAQPALFFCGNHVCVIDTLTRRKRYVVSMDCCPDVEVPYRLRCITAATRITVQTLVIDRSPL